MLALDLRGPTGCSSSSGTSGSALSKEVFNGQVKGQFGSSGTAGGVCSCLNSTGIPRSAEYE